VSAARSTAAVRDRLSTAATFRYAALAGVAALTLSYLSVLYRVTTVVGGADRLVVVSAVTFALALALGRFVGVRAALALTAVLLVGGLGAYLASIPTSQLQLLSPSRLLSDTLALLTGLSVLRLTAADVWALGVAPGPVFLSWYLATRRQYVGSVLAGSGALLLFVLTGDAASATTLFGVAGGTVAIGFGELERLGGSGAQVDTLAVVLSAMLVLSASVAVVPGGGAQPLLPDRGSPTVEASLVEASDRVEVFGSIRLSPTVRFTVESDERQYWATQAYDRYTGSGWVRTGESERLDGRLASPPGESRLLDQTVTAEDRLSVLPAAWKPVSVEGDPGGGVRVTPQGSVRPAGPLNADESYTVRSRVPEASSAELRRTGTNYPDRIREYTQLPEATSDRLRGRAAAVAADADTPYDIAVTIETYLEENKRYSLAVERPDGPIADGFLFEMDAGYCTYFATTMVAMLRSEGVPARFVTGYTPGERVGTDQYVVRGLDAHAWVEVYFPDVGWVRFDPTPAGPRQSAEDARVAEARQDGEEDVDTEATEPAATPASSAGAAGSNASGGDPTDPSANGTFQEGVVASRGNGTPGRLGPGAVSASTESSSGNRFPTPSGEQVAFGLVALVGAVAGARRLGMTGGLVHFVGMWRRGRGSRGDPRADVERAWKRLEHLLARRHRPRRPGETPRAYLTALGRGDLDPRVLAVGRAYERARYGPGVDRDDADEAVAAVDALVLEATPLVRRLT